MEIMSEFSKIEWCDHTFNPWIGCTKVSPGCANCYAEQQDKFRKWTPEGWGKGAPRKRTSEANWKKVEKWNRDAIENDTKPKVFCASLADWLDEEVPLEWFVDLLQLIYHTPHLEWLLLTKRPENFESRLNSAKLRAAGIGEDQLCRRLAGWQNFRYPPNVWVGTTIEDQKRADERIPDLLNIPARRRFLSCEPLLEKVVLPEVNFHCDLCGGTGINYGRCFPCKGKGKIPAISTDPQFTVHGLGGATPMRFIDWVIVGGESGPGSRHFRTDWAESLRGQCQRQKVAFFMKQVGSNAWLSSRNDNGGRMLLGMETSDRKGGNPMDWPEKLRVREFPKED